jgi:hypothetical protein
MSIESIVDKIMWSFGWRPSDVDTYDATVTTMNDATPDQINQIWSAVSTTDGNYATGFGNLLTTLNSQISAFEKVAAPLSHSSYEASTYGYTDAETIYNPDMPDQFGGDQGDPQYDESELQFIVLKYFPNLSPEQVETMLQQLNEGGCGYTALINTLLSHYEHDPADFEKKFGYPLMTTNFGISRYNYEEILTDFYCWVQKNHPEVGTNGLTPGQQCSLWKDYCDAHDLPMHTTVLTDVTTANYKELAEGGTITVGTSPVVLTSLDGQSVQEQGSHRMVITGVKDGKFIVSSWGGEYYLDPNDPSFNPPAGEIDFYQVTYD